MHEVAEHLWLPHIAGVADRTRARYMAAYRYIPQSLRDKELAKVTRQDVSLLVARLQTRQVSRSGKGKVTHLMSASSIATVISVLRQICTVALDAGIIDRLPTDRIKLPRKAPKRERILEPHEAEELLAAMSQTEIALPVVLATVLGLRRSEICGLRWDDLSRQRGELRIVRQVREVKGQGMVEVELKTDSSKRTLHLPKVLIEKMDVLGNLDSPYICGSGKRPMRPNQLTRWWETLRPEAFASWTFHDLRHGAAGLLYALTGNLEAVRTILGHATSDMSLVYIASNKAGRRQAIEDVAKILKL